MWKANGFHGAKIYRLSNFCLSFSRPLHESFRPMNGKYQVAGRNFRKFLKVQFCTVCVAPKQYDWCDMMVNHGHQRISAIPTIDAISSSRKSLLLSQTKFSELWMAAPVLSTASFSKHLLCNSVWPSSCPQTATWNALARQVWHFPTARYFFPKKL